MILLSNPALQLIQTGKGEAIRIRSILRSLVPTEDLVGIISIPLKLPSLNKGKRSSRRLGPSSLPGATLSGSELCPPAQRSLQAVTCRAGSEGESLVLFLVMRVSLLLAPASYSVLCSLVSWTPVPYVPQKWTVQTSQSSKQSKPWPAFSFASAFPRLCSQLGQQTDRV